MSKASRPDPFPTSSYEGVSSSVESALRDYGRALQVLRMYRRRGWPDSAVQLRCRLLSERVSSLIEREEHEYKNPRLF